MVVVVGGAIGVDVARAGGTVARREPPDGSRTVVSLFAVGVAGV